MLNVLRYVYIYIYVYDILIRREKLLSSVIAYLNTCFLLVWNMNTYFYSHVFKYELSDFITELGSNVFYPFYNKKNRRTVCTLELNPVRFF